MGISTYQSYCGSQIFEAIGLNSDFIEKYFPGTATQIEGIGLKEVAEEAVRTHTAAFGNDPVLANMLDAGGEYAWRTRGEEHTWTPESIAKLQHATRSNNYATYKEYAKLINDQTQRQMTLRGLFEIKPAGKSSTAGRSRVGERDRQAFRHRRDVAGFHLHRSAYHAGHRDEPHRRQVEHRRRRRRCQPLQGAARRREAVRHHRQASHRSRPHHEGGRLAAFAHQAGRVRPLRRHGRVPDQRRPDPDQDGAGREARRRRPVARQQSVGIHRQAASLGARRRPDFAAAAPRYLFHRRPGAAHPRPEEFQSGPLPFP